MTWLGKGKTAVGDHAVGRPRAAVVVRFDRAAKAVRLQPDGIFVLKADALVTPLDLPVLDEDGTPIKATGKFHITTETFDPYHMVTDEF